MISGEKQKTGPFESNSCRYSSTVPKFRGISSLYFKKIASLSVRPKSGNLIWLTAVPDTVSFWSADPFGQKVLWDPNKPRRLKSASLIRLSILQSGEVFLLGEKFWRSISGYLDNTLDRWISFFSKISRQLVYSRTEAKLGFAILAPTEC